MPFLEDRADERVAWKEEHEQLFLDWDRTASSYRNCRLTVAGDGLVALPGLAKDMKENLQLMAGAICIWLVLRRRSSWKVSLGEPQSLSIEPLSTSLLRGLGHLSMEAWVFRFLGLLKMLCTVHV